ncbi:prolyl oligopeptidase family serine peptidase [candidate division WOR-3 bacterium]|uniref:prolyl oligopeptidase n=1 Tax=candidate division WOR-3 bacterium TaxID=2052148 RepID=A0A9D5QD89_UNCW3|nr:prolyl oligopeptidase family serine peptidase [candidate division WOR-3 bacterium]MBD3365369.1 prolyl oligopeptidase family serine peptidase [candidate division WOR-3 bacterium]
MKDELIRYPSLRKTDVVEDYNGVKVPDPYRWMEEVESAEVKKWVEAQNEITYGFLRKGKEFDEISMRLRELWNFEKFGLFVKRGERYFFFRNDGLQNQSVLYVKEGLKGAGKVAIDPNTWSDDGTSALERIAVSKDGNLIAYGRGESGSDWQDVRILDIQTGKELPETLHWCRFSQIAWKNDGSGFYYNRYPEAGSVADEDRNNYSRVCFHKLNTSQDEDELVYEDRDNKELIFTPFLTEDGAYLILHVSHGTDRRNRIYYRREPDGRFVKLLDKMESKYLFIHNQGSVFFFLTDLDAPRGRIVVIDVAGSGDGRFKEIIPETEDTLQSGIVVNNRMVLKYMHHACNKLVLYDLEGGFLKEIALPTFGTVGTVTGKSYHKEMFFLFTSFHYPTSVFRFDFEEDELELIAEPDVEFNPDEYETKQVFYSSRDGTRIPMFITHRKGLNLDGRNPVILNGYGGFTVSRLPVFSISNLAWIEKGGIFALANIRGGNEYGEEWHKAGMLSRKQNVFDDFISAAEYLIENKYTREGKLAISGGSNGGLLVAASMLQRPGLFGAVVCGVPVIDMLRYHKWTIGKYWVPEYGDPDNPDHFKFLYAYSPLHNIMKGAEYPPVLITTADTDDRVWPAHSFKFTATLQEKSTCNNPVLLRVERKAGHGHGKPTAKLIEQAADIYSFLFKTLDVK